MREIKFRGFDKETKAWVYGSLLLRDGGVVNIFESNDRRGFAVDSDTVGQFTGLRDKNDKEIYEGDVVKFENRETLPNVGVVTYWEDDCMFVCDSGVGVFELEKRYVTGEHLSEYRYNSYVVIGNIHDNPEFLDKLL